MFCAARFPTQCLHGLRVQTRQCPFALFHVSISSMNSDRAETQWTSGIPENDDNDYDGYADNDHGEIEQKRL